ncbi:putative ribonuclease H-like domain-containing protein [Tanacetum coccineum]
MEHFRKIILKILAFRKELEEIALKHLGTVSENNSTSTPSVNTRSEPVNTSEFDPDDLAMPKLEIFHQSETGIFDEASYDEEGVVTDFNSLPTEIEVSPTPTLRIHNIYPKSQILGDPKSAVQTRSKVQQKSGAHALFSYIQKQQRSNHKDQQHSMQEIVYSLSATVWVLVDLPQGMKEEGIDYDEVFAHVARIEAIRLFLAFASFMGFVVYQMDVKSTFLYGTIDEEVYVSQPLVLLILIILRRFISVKTTITPWKTKMALTRKREWTDVNLKEVTSPSCEEGSSNTFRQPQFGLYTLSVLGMFDGKSDEGFLVGYSLNSKAYRVYNLVTKRVEVNLHVNFLEDKPNVKGVGYRWMFDIDYLTDSMNYIPVSLKNQANPHAGVSEVTNSAVPSIVRNTEEKAESRKSSTNSKKEEILTYLQQEKKASSTEISEDNPKILAFRRELEEIALKHLGKVSENTTTSTPSVNTGSEPVKLTFST